MVRPFHGMGSQHGAAGTLATRREICREHGISQPTFYNWKSKYGGLDANQLKELKDLKAENARLKKLYAEACMDREALKDLLSGKL